MDFGYGTRPGHVVWEPQTLRAPSVPDAGQSVPGLCLWFFLPKKFFLLVWLPFSHRPGLDSEGPFLSLWLENTLLSHQNPSPLPFTLCLTQDACQHLNEFVSVGTQACVYIPVCA